VIDYATDYRVSEQTDAELTAEQLLTAVGRGDRSSFSLLYDRMAPRVFGLVRKLIIDSAQAEEVTQEIFLEVWQNAARFDELKGGAVGWIMTMTHRRTVDRIRASQAAHDRDLRIGVRDFQDTADIADAIETIVESERVKAAMARLTSLQRQAITLAYFGGLSHTEISAHLQVPVGTIKTRLRDGLIRLRDEMGVTS
jgi:RNA polymerase sigma-70 factor (ECF subfamily)